MIRNQSKSTQCVKSVQSSQERLQRRRFGVFIVDFDQGNVGGDDRTKFRLSRIRFLETIISLVNILIFWEKAFYFQGYWFGATFKTRNLFGLDQLVFSLKWQ